MSSITQLPDSKLQDMEMIIPLVIDSTGGIQLALLAEMYTKEDLNENDKTFKLERHVSTEPTVIFS